MSHPRRCRRAVPATLSGVWVWSHKRSKGPLRGYFYTRRGLNTKSKSKDKRMNIAFRITNSYLELSAFCDKLTKHCDKLVVYQHDTTRTHIHGLILNCKVSTDTLKNYVKHALGVQSYPKTDWSFKTEHKGNPVSSDFITYMSKGSLQPSMQFGYTIEELEHYKSLWVDIVPKRKREMVQYKLKLENPREAKIRQNELLDMVKQRVKESGLKQPRDILQAIRQVVYVEHRTIVGRYKIRDFYDYVLADVCPETWEDQMIKIISFKEV